MVSPNEPATQLSSLYREMAPLGLKPLWEELSQLVPEHPTSPAVPHLWRYEEARGYLMRAGELITAAQAERRVLILENPGLRGNSSIVPSLYAGLQLILPGEIAPCHRHAQCALRLVLEGDGAFTAIDGEKAVMKPFDLVLTPAGHWHDHGNTTDEPMIWLDGLDIPTVRHFDAGFSERFAQASYPETAVPGDTLTRYGRNLRPLRGTATDRRPGRQRLFHYPHKEWYAALRSMASFAEIDTHVGHALEFVNPADGGSVMTTISAHVRLLPAGFSTLGRRTTDGTVFVVIEGEGNARIDGRTLNLVPRDIFVVPSWATVKFAARSQLVLFGYSDRAAQERLGLYKEERL